MSNVENYVIIEYNQIRKSEKLISEDSLRREGKENMKFIKRVLLISLSILILFYSSNFLLFKFSEYDLLEIKDKKIVDFLENYELNYYDFIQLPIFYNTKNIIPFDFNQDEKEVCCNQVPQGITKTEDDEIVFTSYCSSYSHHSFIYILKNDKLKTIEVNNKCHLGGITYDYDNQNFWICLDNANIGKISKKDLMLKDTLEEVDMEIFHISDLDSASYITYYNNRLYVGEFSALSCGKLCVFPFILNGELLTKKEIKFSFPTFQTYPVLTPISTVETPSQIQGITFHENKIYMSQSFGRRLNSHILIYEHNDDYTDYTSEHLLEEKELPPLLEEIYIEDDELYLLFESAAKKYQFTTLQPIDKIIKEKL